MPVDKFGRMSDAKTRDTGVSLTYINNNYIRSDGGTPVSGSINMNGNTLYNLSDPVNSRDAATKKYVDDSGGGAFEARNGGYNAKGPIYMGGHKMGGIKDPKKGGEATNKRYVDKYVNEYVDDYVEKFKDENGFFASPWDINMIGT